MHKLSELFAAPRGDIRTVTKINGIGIFTSSELKERYLLAMGKTDKSIPIIKTITKLLQDGTLTPVYSTHKLLQSIRKKQPIQLRGFAGVVLNNKNIYIFVETDANIFSFTSNEDLATVTIHELIHYISASDSKDFYNIFKEDLENFYEFYFTRLLSSSKSDVKDLVNFIHFNLESNPFNISNSLLREYYDLIFSTFKDTSTLSEEAFTKIVTDLIVLIKLLQKLAESGSTQFFAQTAVAYKYIISPLYVTYKHTKSVNPMEAKTLCFQELWSTSEVIAVPSMIKLPSPKVYKAINKL